MCLLNAENSNYFFKTLDFMNAQPEDVSHRKGQVVSMDNVRFNLLRKVEEMGILKSQKDNPFEIHTAKHFLCPSYLGYLNGLTGKRYNYEALTKSEQPGCVADIRSSFSGRSFVGREDLAQRINLFNTHSRRLAMEVIAPGYYKPLKFPVLSKHGKKIIEKEG